MHSCSFSQHIAYGTLALIALVHVCISSELENSRFFSHLRHFFVVRRDSHLSVELDTWAWEAHSFLCVEEDAKPHPGLRLGCQTLLK